MASHFSAEERERIREAIAAAEQMTSGQMRVFFEAKCNDDPVARALTMFHKLEMQKTALRNAVLFYVAYDDRKFAIIGDEGIHEKVPEDFWLAVRDVCVNDFKEGNFVTGLQRGIGEVGTQLQKWFPHNATDTNELSDDVIESDE